MCIQGVEFFELLGDGDLSVSQPSIFEGFFLQTLKELRQQIIQIEQFKSSPFSQRKTWN